jgi:hypothetical protein
MKLSVFLDEKLVYVHVFDLQERQPDGVLCFFLFSSAFELGLGVLI